MTLEEFDAHALFGRLAVSVFHLETHPNYAISEEDKRLRAFLEGLPCPERTVSRIERALKLPTMPNVIAWMKACGATAHVVERVTALTDAAHTHIETWRELASRSPHLQDAVQANEATAATLRNYSPLGTPAGHAAQLDRIVSLSTLDNVSVGVLPDDGSAVTLPFPGFVIYGDWGEEDPFVTVQLHRSARG